MTGLKALAATAITALVFGGIGGTSGAWLMRDHLTGPEGPQGDRGPSGPSGPAGPAGPEATLDLAGLPFASGDLSTVLTNILREQADQRDRLDDLDGSNPFAPCESIEVLTAVGGVVDLRDPVQPLLFPERICVTRP